MFNNQIIGKMYSYFMSKGFDDYKNGWITGACPDCGESRTGKYALHLEQNRGNCFICGCKDKPFRVIQRMEKVETNHETYRVINTHEGFDYVPQAREEKRVYKTLELPTEYKMLGLYKSMTAKIVETNLLNRGFSINRLMRAGVGYCASGEYKGRIIIPYYQNSKLVYFNARQFIEIGTKFKNPSTEEFGIGKTQIIYNIDALYIYRRTWLFESATNALTLGGNAIGTGGKILSRWQISTIISSPCKSIIIGLDDDAQVEAYKLGMELAQYKRVKVLRFPPGLDANKLGRRKTIALEKATPWQSYKELYKLYLNEKRG